MQYEWKQYLQGILITKENQGMLWIIGILLFVYLWYKKEQYNNSFVISSLVLGLCTVCPITAVLLLKGYTPFYNWLDLQQVFPLLILAAWFGTELFFFLKGRTIPGLKTGKYVKNIISLTVVVFVFACAVVFHGFDRTEKVNENGIPIKTAEVFDELQNVVGEGSLVLGAPDSMLSYVRLHSADWHPVYGRDLWDPKAASYIFSGYDKEYRYYDIFSSADLSTEHAQELTRMINEEELDCCIVQDHWLLMIGATPGYDRITLINGYTGIIKKDFLTK